jgi:hypothetical protein
MTPEHGKQINELTIDRTRFEDLWDYYLERQELLDTLLPPETLKKFPEN